MAPSTDVSSLSTDFLQAGFLDGSNNPHHTILSWISQLASKGGALAVDTDDDDDNGGDGDNDHDLKTTTTLLNSGSEF
jgi:hypothetical protein